MADWVCAFCGGFCDAEKSLTLHKECIAFGYKGNEEVWRECVSSILTTEPDFLVLGPMDASTPILGGRLRIGVGIPALLVAGGEFTKKGDIYGQFQLSTVRLEPSDLSGVRVPVIKNTVSRAPTFRNAPLNGDSPMCGRFIVAMENNVFYHCTVDAGILKIENGVIQPSLFTGSYLIKDTAAERYDSVYLYTGVPPPDRAPRDLSGTTVIDGYDTFPSQTDLSGNPLSCLASLDLSTESHTPLNAVDSNTPPMDPSGNHVIHLAPVSGECGDRLLWCGQPLSTDVCMMGSALDYSEDIADTVLQSYDGVQCTEKTGKDGRKYLVFTNSTDAPVVVSIFTTAADAMVSISNLLLPLKQFLGLTEATRVDVEATPKLPTHDIRDIQMVMIDEPQRVRFYAANGNSYTIQNLRMETFLKILTELTERYATPPPIANFEFETLPTM